MTATSLCIAAGSTNAQTLSGPVEQLTPCQEVLKGPEMQNIKDRMGELHAGVGRYLNERLMGLDCTYDELKGHFLELGFEFSSDFENKKGFHFSIDYYSPIRDIIAKLFGNHIGGGFAFDKEKKFINTAWGVSK